MFGRGIKLFTLLGFEVRLDFSWIIIAVLITWTLAAGLFPQRHPGFSPGTYVAMGAVGALGLFLSIILHEFAHSIVARKFNIPMRGITLFIFGGVAEMEKEPPRPKAEFFMAIAGPIMTGILIVVFAALSALGTSLGWPTVVNAIVTYLAGINFIILLFNLVPAFPLDGGRVLRAALWAWKKNVKWATRIASAIGTGFGWFLVIWGVLGIFSGNFLGGFWMVLIGMFLRNASRVGYQQLFLRQELEGEPVRRFMHPNPVTVSPATTIQQFVDDYVLAYHHKTFPVVEGDALLGAISLNQVKTVPPEQRLQRTVGEFMVPANPENTVQPNTDAMEAISKMAKTKSSRLMVTEGGHLAGILSLKDLQNFLSLKIELDPT